MSAGRRVRDDAAVDAQAVLQVLDALEAAGIRPGITGGWGVDALLGRQTRDHRDLDIGVRDAQVATAVTVLQSLGYAVTADERPARIALASGRGSVDIHPIEFDATGHGVQQGFDGQTFEYPIGSLEADGMIGSRRVKVATPELQLAFHSGYLPAGHDLQDVRALVAEFGLAVPEGYGSRMHRVRTRLTDRPR